jgi:hypothetical protein
MYEGQKVAVTPSEGCPKGGVVLNENDNENEYALGIKCYPNQSLKILKSTIII